MGNTQAAGAPNQSANFDTGGNLSFTLNDTGGNGGSASSGSAAAGGTIVGSTTLTQTDTLPGTATTTANTNALGGNGGSFTGANGNGAAGGAATATSTASSSGSDPVNASATATGGNGGSGAGTGSGGAGGNASATATTTGSAVTTVTAIATGGMGAGSLPLGTASATATATGSYQMTWASATAIGSSGAATANGSSTSASDPYVESISGMSSAPTSGSSQAVVESLIGLPATSLSLGSAPQAGALGIGDPAAANVAAAWSAETNVPAAFGTTSEVQGLSVFNLADTVSAVDPSFDYHSQLVYTLNGTNLSSQDLLVGLLSPTIGGVGLTGSDYLTFEIDRQGSQVFFETFTSNAALVSFFTDNVLNLGPENAGLGRGTLSLEFKFDFNSSATGAGFSEGLVFGAALATPEPSTSILFALGAAGLLLPAIRQRRARRDLLRARCARPVR